MCLVILVSLLIYLMILYKNIMLIGLSLFFIVCNWWCILICMLFVFCLIVFNLMSIFLIKVILWFLKFVLRSLFSLLIVFDVCLVVLI